MLDARKLIVSPPPRATGRRPDLECRPCVPWRAVPGPRIDQNVALAAIDAFRAVVATDAADASRTNRLAVDDACTRLGVAPDVGAELLAQDCVEVLPGAVQTP